MPRGLGGGWFQLLPSWLLLWGDMLLCLWGKEASSHFLMCASETSLLIFGFEGHLYCQMLFSLSSFVEMVGLLYLSHHSVFHVNERKQK